MADSVETITQNIINQIRATDPAFSFEVGTPERSIIEGVSTQIAQAQADFSVLDTQGNIDAMTGARLDAYLNLFGFSRQLATSATGTVTFSRDTPAVADILIPFGTQLKASDTDPDTPDVYFTTTESVTLAAGTTSIDAPVIAATPGSIGNVAAGTVTGFATLTGIPGITTITNALPMTGGLDFETDEQLRVRFKNGIFRNMAGTFDNFMALALSGENTTKANVLGPMSRYQEYMLVPAVDDTGQGTSADPNGNYDPGSPLWAKKRTTAASRIPYSKYTYVGQNYVTDGTIGGKVFKPDHDYFFNKVPVNPASGTRAALTSDTYGNPKTQFRPNITILGKTGPIWPAGMEPGSVVLVEFAYMSKHSRNSVPNGVMNAVDIFVNGEKARTVKSIEMYSGDGNLLQNTDTTRWTYNGNFRRILDDSQSASGNRMHPVYWNPIISLPDTMTIANDDTHTYTFYKARYKSGGEYYYDAGFTRVANYFETEEVGGYYGTIRARGGIEFRHKRTFASGDTAGSPSGPWADDVSNASKFLGHQFTCNYVSDQNIRDMQAIMEKNKQITSDVLVHKATPRYFIFYVAVMYTPGANVTTTNALINTQLQAFLDNQYFGSVIQLSDVLQIIHNTPGVDNVRWSSDLGSSGITHKVEEVGQDGSAIASNPSPGFTIASSHSYTEDDFFLQDNELATAPSVPLTSIIVRTQNTWGS